MHLMRQVLQNAPVIFVGRTIASPNLLVNCCWFAQIIDFLHVFNAQRKLLMILCFFSSLYPQVLPVSASDTPLAVALGLDHF